MREREQREIINPGFREHLEFFFARREELRRRCRVHYFERVRIETHDQAAPISRARITGGRSLRMAAVTTIEVPTVPSSRKPSVATRIRGLPAVYQSPATTLNGVRPGGMTFSASTLTACST